MMAGLFWPGPAPGQESEAEKLKRGDILISFHPSPRSDLSEVSGVILFDAPLNLVWKVLANFPEYRRFLPGVTLSQVVKQEGPNSWVKFEERNLWPSPNFRYQLKITTHAETNEIAFNMEDGNLKALYGNWKLEPFSSNPNQTKATYNLLQDPGYYLLAMTQNLSNRSLVLEQLDAFNAEIRLEKQRQEGAPGQVIRPKWRKALPWWEERQPPRGPSETKPAPAKP
jgi:ribosome-associated toxin RatA of RatAB toxin-antitoxin module